MRVDQVPKPIAVTLIHVGLRLEVRGRGHVPALGPILLVSNRKPAGAVTVDSTALSPEAVVQRILEAVEQARCCTGS